MIKDFIFAKFKYLWDHLIDGFMTHTSVDGVMVAKSIILSSLVTGAYAEWVHEFVHAGFVIFTIGAGAGLAIAMRALAIYLLSLTRFGRMLLDMDKRHASGKSFEDEDDAGATDEETKAVV